MIMKPFILASLVGLFAFTSCETAHRAAVGTFRVVDAPAAYMRRQLGVDDQGQTTTTTTQTTYSDTAGYPPQQPQPYPPRQTNVTQQPPPQQTQRRVVTEERSREPAVERQQETAPAPRTAREEAPVTAPRTTQNTAPPQNSELPYAKPVPGKPGYVFSPYDSNGGYVDVKGYTPGQKVKDPYSGKIFLVP